MDAQTKRLVEREVGIALWEQGKARAKELVKETEAAERALVKVNFAWGDLALEIVPQRSGSGSRPTQTIWALLGAFVEDYAYPNTTSTLSVARHVASAWPRDRRKLDLTWTTHVHLAALEDRYDLIQENMTPKQAEKLVNARRLGATGTHEQRTVTALECATAVTGWTRSLAKRVTDKPDEELIAAIREAWQELNELIESLGIQERLLVGATS